MLAFCQAFDFSFYVESAAQNVQGVGFFAFSVVVTEEFAGAVIGYFFCLIFLNGCRNSQIALVFIQRKAVVYAARNLALRLSVKTSF